MSTPCKLGNCDAFLSHSWHDDALAKWEELQNWRALFLRVHGREPVVWFDKFCLDQCNIGIDLRCLPVFLSGCQKLVVLCGTTYLSRLWCIAEIFTFVHMGGALNRILWLPVVRDDCRIDDVATIRRSLGDFDAQTCECAVEGDREQMFSIIEAAYGSMDSFSEVVREVLLASFSETMGNSSGTHATGVRTNRSFATSTCDSLPSIVSAAV